MITITLLLKQKDDKETNHKRIESEPQMNRTKNWPIKGSNEPKTNQNEAKTNQNELQRGQ
jgi:hypothetical protein